MRNGCNAGVYREIFATKTRNVFQNDDISDLFAEIKGRGYEVKAVRQILKIKKQDQTERGIIAFGAAETGDAQRERYKWRSKPLLKNANRLSRLRRRQA